MDFTETELHNLLTAVADQKYYYKQALAGDTFGGHSLAYYKGKLEENTKLYAKLQAALLALETAETL